MTDTERAKLRLECFLAVKGYGHFEGEGKNKHFVSNDYHERITDAEDLFEWCVKEGNKS